MYDHRKQYRCAIIRGKAKKDLDNILPAYALVLDTICPCKEEDFENEFNSEFSPFLDEKDRIKKTFDNHRTEISGKLFGMYYRADDGYVYESERTQKFIADNDQPSFFKDMCFKHQFPNGTQTIREEWRDRLQQGIRIRPYAFILKLLRLAEKERIPVTRRNIGYYVLNSLDVLTGVASPEEVLSALKADQKKGILREIHEYDDEGNEKAYSYRYQHITEQLNYLELANLTRTCGNGQIDDRVVINPRENDTVDLFIESLTKPLLFDVYSYDLSTVELRKQFQYDWDKYYGKLAMPEGFETTADALTFNAEVGTAAKAGQQGKDYTVISRSGGTTTGTFVSTLEIGDEGENIVFNYEKDRVSSYSTRLAKKVLALGKTKGLGYDIQSVVAEPGDMDEFVKYIEVKSTKRATCPDLNDPSWTDAFDVTRNEWVAAKQHKEMYSIYRVYFTQQGIFVFLIEDVAQKLETGTLKAVPSLYHFYITGKSIDRTIKID